MRTRLLGLTFNVPYRALVSGRSETPGVAIELLLAPGGGGASATAPLRWRNVSGPCLTIAGGLPRVRARSGFGWFGTCAAPARAGCRYSVSRACQFSQCIQRELRQRGIDCYVYGGRGLYARPEIQDLVNLLRAVADPVDPVVLAAFLRSPLGGVDNLALFELTQATSRKGPPTKAGSASLFDALKGAYTYITMRMHAGLFEDALALLQLLIGLKDRLPHHQLLDVRAIAETAYRVFLSGAPDAPAGLRNIDKFLRIVRTGGSEPLAHFVESIGARVRRAEPEDQAPIYTPDNDVVVISTVHKAKGLEWPYVFLTGL